MGGTYACESSYKGFFEEHAGNNYVRKDGHKCPTKELTV